MLSPDHMLEIERPSLAALHADCCKVESKKMGHLCYRRQVVAGGKAVLLAPFAAAMQSLSAEALQQLLQNALQHAQVGIPTQRIKFSGGTGSCIPHNTQSIDQSALQSVSQRVNS